MKIKKSRFVGKTISSMNTRAVNRVVFKFTDGSQAGLECVAVVPHVGLYGIEQERDEGEVKAVMRRQLKGKKA